MIPCRYFSVQTQQAEESQVHATLPSGQSYDLRITDKTIKKIRSLMQKDPSKKYLKIFVDSGGCSGFQYNFKMVNGLTEGETEVVFKRDGAEILVDETTLEFIGGSTIDFKAEMIKQGFEVIANPNAEVGCSCGTSFSLKEK
ncbi:hypothetical protein FGO68_gene110 [Halteria grandinella]|uniref:Core domain-containing protein n=1 Tax=Halteria grandinella TaxID=5974 RepID=A0A8J8NI49_HALGN|nr:hypothetical protein FGO68_gene110 [Halteria grandinella]